MSGIVNVQFGTDVKILGPVNAYGCKIGDRTKVGPFVEIQKDVLISEDCIVSSHSFICSGVSIGARTFVGHGVMFINDKFDSPDIKNWNFKTTEIGQDVRIGSNATILPVKIQNSNLIHEVNLHTKI